MCVSAPGAEVSVSPVMGKGFPVEKIPAEGNPTVLLFATGQCCGLQQLVPCVCQTMACRFGRRKTDSSTEHERLWSEHTRLWSEHKSCLPACERRPTPPNCARTAAGKPPSCTPTQNHRRVCIHVHTQWQQQRPYWPLPCLSIHAGSGISPIKALIESGQLEADKRSDVRLYYGTRDAGGCVCVGGSGVCGCVDTCCKAWEAAAETGMSGVCLCVCVGGEAGAQFVCGRSHTAKGLADLKPHLLYVPASDILTTPHIGLASQQHQHNIPQTLLFKYLLCCVCCRPHRLCRVHSCLGKVWCQGHPGVRGCLSSRFFFGMVLENMFFLSWEEGLGVLVKGGEALPATQTEQHTLVRGWACARLLSPC